MWHKLTLVGKILLFLVGIGFGIAIGLYIAPNEGVNNSGVNTEITIEKNKNGNVIIDTKSGQQKEEEQPKEKKKFLGIF